MRVVKYLSLFLISFAISLTLWFLIKDIYYISLAKISSELLAFKYDLTLLDFELKSQDIVLAEFVSDRVYPFSNLPRFQTIVEIDNIEYIVFNLPLTIAIILTLTLKNFKFKTLFEALLLLMALHIGSLYISILHILSEAPHFIGAFQDYYLLSKELLKKIEIFFINYLIKAEPFLIGLYIIFRDFKQLLNRF